MICYGYVSRLCSSNCLLNHTLVIIISIAIIMQDLLFSYNIAVDRSDEMTRTLKKSAASVGLQLPDVYQPWEWGYLVSSICPFSTVIMYYFGNWIVNLSLCALIWAFHPLFKTFFFSDRYCYSVFDRRVHTFGIYIVLYRWVLVIWNFLQSKSRVFILQWTNASLIVTFIALNKRIWPCLPVRILPYNEDIHQSYGALL